MSRSLIRFENRKGMTLKGVRFDPEYAPVQPRAIVYLPGIVLGSQAVHRLGTQVAEHVSRLGLRTLVFDHAGIGESEGSFQGGTHGNLTDWVMRGALVDDTLDAIAYVEREFQAREVYLVGHCGGALTSAYAAARHESVRGVFLIAPPTLGTAGRPLRRADDAEANLAAYRRKVFSLSAWRRLLAFESDFAGIGEAVMGRAWKLANRPVADIFNMDLIQALQAMTERKLAMHVFFGDHDPDLKHFMAFTKNPMAPPISFTVQKDARHGFLNAESLDGLLESVGDFAFRGF